MSERFKTGLLGWPVAHSLSPMIHNAAFDELGLKGNYELYPCVPEDLHRTVTNLMDDGITGLNVTIPHKETILNLPQISEISPDVEKIGAANTLTRIAGDNLRASNTDWRGSREELLINGVVLNQDTRVIILGTGGSAKSLTYTLQVEGVEQIWYISRVPLHEDKNTVDYTQLSNLVNDFTPTLIINTTPLGLWPNVEQSPWPQDLPFPQDAVLFDLIYRPTLTRLMRQAQENGAQVIGGLGMLIRQASFSFAEWTGQRPTYNTMFNAIQQGTQHG